MPDPRPVEFGKRRPVTPLPPGPPVKRSGHVALLLMGTLAVGGGAYALMPRTTCEPPSSGLAAPAQPQTGTGCSTTRSSYGGGGGGGSSRYGLFGDSSSRSSSTASSDSNASSVSRGGFGSVARAFGFSGRG